MVLSARQPLIYLTHEKGFVVKGQRRGGGTVRLMDENSEKRGDEIR
jgi:transcriptional regulator CtsR